MFTGIVEEFGTRGLWTAIEPRLRAGGARLVLEGADERRACCFQVLLLQVDGADVLVCVDVARIGVQGTPERRERGTDRGRVMVAADGGEGGDHRVQAGEDVRLAVKGVPAMRKAMSGLIVAAVAAGEVHDHVGPDRALRAGGPDPVAEGDHVGVTPARGQHEDAFFAVVRAAHRGPGWAPTAHGPR